MTAEMTRALTDHIKRAFEKANLLLVSLSVIHYSPEAFGNFVAIADTGKGRRQITYDRGFFVQAVEDAFPDGAQQHLGANPQQGPSLDTTF